MARQPVVFDEGVAANYEVWYETPAGRKADALEKGALLRLLKRFLDTHSVLEVGAGTGHFSRWFRAEGLGSVGLELSEAMLAEARRLDGVTLVQGDAGQLPFAQGASDVVALITTLEFLPDPRRALSEALRVARYGLLLGVLNRWSPLGVKRWLLGFFRPSVYDAAHFYSLGELERMLRSVAGQQVHIAWETTLLLDWWPLSGSHQRWGGFIAMALLKPDKQQ